jgi:hypothetical protein
MNSAQEMLSVLNPLDLGFYLRQPWLLVLFAFQIWMLVDAIRREEWIWALFIFIFPVLNAVLYFFLVYRASRPAGPIIEIPGRHRRKRMQELQAQIHHLDKAHHHAELGDLYMQDGRIAEAEQSYRAAIERDASDIDFQAHLGECLLQQGKIQEAAPLLEKVAAANPRHEYGQTLMAWAETLAKLGRPDESIRAWQQVLQEHGYARARVQLAELFIKRGDKEAAGKELAELMADEEHAAAFQRKKDKPWIKRANALLKEVK